MIEWHVVGQRVVCIDDVMTEYRDEHHPIKGQIYTIRDVVPPDRSGQVSFRLCEIHNAPLEYLDYPGQLLECAFYARRFRPVKKTSIEQFHRILRQVEEYV
jgi:hypothetical protein